MKQLRKALENQVWLLVAVRGVELPVRNGCDYEFKDARVSITVGLTVDIYCNDLS